MSKDSSEHINPSTDPEIAHRMGDILADPNGVIIGDHSDHERRRANRIKETESEVADLQDTSLELQRGLAENDDTGLESALDETREDLFEARRDLHNARKPNQ